MQCFVVRKDKRDWKQRFQWRIFGHGPQFKNRLSPRPKWSMTLNDFYGPDQIRTGDLLDVNETLCR